MNPITLFLVIACALVGLALGKTVDILLAPPFLVAAVVIALSLYHWAHRFRYTLYDGLQLYHLNLLIATLTYGVATLLTLAAAGVVLVW